MKNRDLSARVDRLALAIAKIKRNRGDNEPTLAKCSNPGCHRLTQAGLCLVCYERAEYRMNRGLSPLEPMSSV